MTATPTPVPLIPFDPIPASDYDKCVLPPDNPIVSFVVPAFNEQANLSACVQTLHATLSTLKDAYELILVDDGSSDGTLQVADRLEREYPGIVRICAHPTHQGLGAALQTGFAAARGEFVGCCPADFRITPEIWAPFHRALGTADVLVGCRPKRVGYNPLMRLNAWLYLHLVRLLFHLTLRDVNWICAYRRSLLRQIPITQKGIPMLAEILIRLRDLGATFIEVDCPMQSRRAGTPSAARFPVMVHTLTGLLRFWIAYRRSSTSQRRPARKTGTSPPP